MALTLLKEIFAGFVRARHISRHFRRLALLDTLTQTDVNRELPAHLSQALVQAARSTPAAICCSSSCASSSNLVEAAVGRSRMVSAPRLGRLPAGWGGVIAV